MAKLISLLLLFFLFFVFLQSNLYGIKSPPNSLTFGILAKRGEEVEKNRFYKLKSYLEKRLPYPIEFRFLPFEELKKQALEGKLNFILTNPYQAILIKELGKRDQINYKIILSLSQWEKDNYYPYFGGVIFTRKDSAIRDLKGLKGMKLGAVDPESFGGYLIALYELYRVGIKEEDIKPKFYGTHDKVVYAVLKGEVPVGTVRTGILERMIQLGQLSPEDIKILNQRYYQDFPLLVSSSLYPEWPVLALEGTPQEIIKEFAKVLLEIEPHTDLAKSIEGIFYLPLDYTPIEKLLFDLMKGPYKELREVYFQRFKERFLPYVIGFLLFFLTLLAILSYILFQKNKLLGRTKKSLEEEKTFLDTVLRHTDFMVFYLTPEGRVVWANQKGEKICYTNSSASKPPLWEECSILNGLKNFKSYFEEKKYLTGPINFVETIEINEFEKTYEGELIPLKRGNQVEGILFFLRDMTEKVILEKQKLFLEKLNVLKHVAGGLAHDFNNHLLIVMNQLELLKTKINMRKSSPEVKGLFASLQDSLMALRLLGRELLTLVRGESPVKERADLEDLIRHYTSLALAGKKNYEVHYEIERPLPLIEVDKELFSIMWMNLVLNALEAMPNGGRIFISIKPLYHEDIPYIRFSIRDEGVGLPEKYKDKIFEPFFTTKPGGSGLGLYVVMEVVKAHQGKIEFTSKEGEGTTFILEFPALPGEISSRRNYLRKERKPKILLMDDDDIIRDTLKELLEHFNYEVETAPNGEAALEIFSKAKLEKRSFDYVILDLIVPGRLNGFETYQKIRELDPSVKGILISGYFDKPILQNYKNYGLHGALIKPFTIQQLLEVLEK